MTSSPIVAIAPRGAHLELPALVGEAHRGAVDLHFGGVARGFYFGDLPSVSLLPRGQLLGAEGVASDSMGRR